jgi:hypothetical protein
MGATHGRNKYSLAGKHKGTRQTPPVGEAAEQPQQRGQALALARLGACGPRPHVHRRHRRGCRAEQGEEVLSGGGVVAQQDHHLRFGCIVVTEIEAPNMLVNVV